MLRSTAEWAGPGHPSLAIDTEGRPTLFFHAFFPGEAAYKAFRALLAVTLAFEDGQVRVIGDTVRS